MDLAEQLERLTSRGFDEEGARTVVLIREALIVLSKAFPDSFSLYGGANLILFHESVRTSRDLDLLRLGDEQPGIEEVTRILTEGLQELSALLGYAPLTMRIDHGRAAPFRLELLSSGGANLFTIDIGGLGTAAASGMQRHSLQGVSRSAKAFVSVVSKHHLLLQKAEAFVGRARVKSRDAYDINFLLGSGAALSSEMEDGLADSLVIRELDGEDIAARIAAIDERKCAAELRSVLPIKIYRPLEEAGFEPLRASLRKLFHKWL
jgi:hypothetical protein